MSDKPDRPAEPNGKTDSPYRDGGEAYRAVHNVSRVQTALPSDHCDAPRARAPRSGGPLTRTADRIVGHGSRLRQALTQATDGRTYRRFMRDLLMRGRSMQVDEFGFDPVAAEAMRPVFEFLYHNYWRVETRGLANVPDRGRTMIVCNHGGILPLDAAMLMYALRFEHPAHRPSRPLIDDPTYYLPYVGVAVGRAGGVRASPENARRLLQREELVIAFPEGTLGSAKTYKNRYKLQRFGRGGFVKLALRTRTPIIPAAVVGAEDVHPILKTMSWPKKALGFPFFPVTPLFPWLGPLGLLPLPSKWYILFGTPFEPSRDHAVEDAEDSVLVNRISEQIRGAVQKLLDEGLNLRQQQQVNRREA